MPKGHSRERSHQLLSALHNYEGTHGVLTGLTMPGHRATFVEQMISSLRRVEYVREITRRDVAASRCNPLAPEFDPIKGAALLGRQGYIDEAVWLAFIGTHFGKHHQDSWKLAANVMGSFGEGPIWTLKHFGTHSLDFKSMLQANKDKLSDAILSGRYSNHRQYQSKKPELIFNVFQSFSDWFHQQGSFVDLVRYTHTQSGQDPTSCFDALYRTLDDVYGFGRLGKFDLLTMLGKLDLAPIEPGSVYLVGATGPLAGARLLFYGDRKHAISAAKLEPKVNQLDEFLKIGKQPLEDSLCNWQKSPHKYKYFAG